MAIPSTKSGRNMYDMLSMLQKAIRRGRYREAAYAANELERIYRSVMWSRILVISAEDCYGVLTKELIALKDLDDAGKNNELVGNAIAIMCKAQKSRDACYFACNFILDCRCPRTIKLSDEELAEYEERFDDADYDFDKFGFKQMSMFDKKGASVDVIDVATLCKALAHRDMDMIGFQMNKLRTGKRRMLWNAFKFYVEKHPEYQLMDEIEALERADDFVNRNRKDGQKDEIFISKAAMLICYAGDGEDVRSSEVVELGGALIDWKQYKTKKIDECPLPNNEIPEWVFDCHTLKGKRMGKTDWDMTVDEQAGLYPKKKMYFDDASWLYTYEQDVRNGVLTEEGFAPIKKFAETHEANPVSFIPYDE